MRRLDLCALWLACGVVGCGEMSVCDSTPHWCQPFVVSEIEQPDRLRAIDITFVSDGYLATDLPEYKADVARLTASLARMSRYLTARVPGLFNFHVVGVPSSTREVESEVTKDTALGAHLVADQKGGSPLVEVDRQRLMRLAERAPRSNAVVAVVRGSMGRAHADRQVLTAGGTPAVVRISSLAARVEDGTLTHELGHALFGLGDEYPLANRCPAEWGVDERTFVEVPNLSVDPMGEKWHGLVEGAHQGGDGYATCVVHPSGRCRMNSSEAEFCPVCAARIEAVLAIVNCGVNPEPPRVALPPAIALDGVGRAFRLDTAASELAGIESFEVRLGEELLYRGPYLKQVWLTTSVPEGEHRTATLCARVADAAGLASQSCAPLRVAPALFAPVPGAWAMDSVSILLNGAPQPWVTGDQLQVTVSGGSDPRAPLHLLGVELDGRFIAGEGPLTPESSHTVTAHFVDRLGLRGSVRKNFDGFPPSELQLEFEPARATGALIFGTVAWLLRVSSDGSFPAPELTLKVAGEAVAARPLPRTMDTQRRYAFDLDTATLPEGPFAVTATVRDAWGRSVTASLPLVAAPAPSWSIDLRSSSPRLEPEAVLSASTAQLPPSFEIVEIRLLLGDVDLGPFARQPFTWSHPLVRGANGEWRGIGPAADVLAPGPVTFRALAIFRDAISGERWVSSSAPLTLPFDPPVTLPPARPVPPAAACALAGAPMRVAHFRPQE